MPTPALSALLSSIDLVDIAVPLSDTVKTLMVALGSSHSWCT